MVANAYDTYYEYLDAAKEAGTGIRKDDLTGLMVTFKLDSKDAEAVYNRWLAYDTASNCMTWHAIGRYGKVAQAMLNDKYEIFLINWDGTRTKGANEPPYKLYTKLPGIKANLDNFVSVEDAQAKAVRVLSHWLYQTGLVSTKGM